MVVRRVYDSEFNWEGEEVRIRCEVEPPDDETGVAAPMPSSVQLFDDTGSLIPLTLEQIEELLMDQDLLNAIDAWYYSEGGDDDVR